MRIINVMTFVACGLLSGCALNLSAPQQTGNLSHQDPLWQKHVQKLEQIQQYETLGQIGVISPQGRFSTSFQWQYAPKNYHLHLSGFLNMASMDLQKTAKGLTLIDDKGRKHQNEDAEFLLMQVLGTRLTLEELAQWLKGLPAKKATYQVSEQHLLRQFIYPTQGETWTVTYLSYHHNLAIPMPKDVLIQGKYRTLKIRIKEWQW